ncbi:hypothetical protein OC845_005324 [Tilletia horrida]|nr:hypothetical protein OC845_005324 [Tilletia horrida]
MDGPAASPVKAPSRNFVWALHDFEAEAPDEISFKAGDKITVMETDDQYNDNWWLGTTQSGQSGLFPSTYTTPDKAVMLASRSAFAAVPEVDDEEGASAGLNSGAQSLMGNTMAELDDALKQMQRDPRASYAGTDFSANDFDNETELGDDDDADGIRRARNQNKEDDEIEEDGEEDYLATRSTAARAALALRAKSNALSATERERNEAEQRKAAAQKRLEEEEERQRALILEQSDSIKTLGGEGAAASATITTTTTTTSNGGLQRKSTLTSKRLPLKDVELSDESDSEAGDHLHQHQKRTNKGKTPIRGDATDGQAASSADAEPESSADGAPQQNSIPSVVGDQGPDERKSLFPDTSADTNSVLLDADDSALTNGVGGLALLQQRVAAATGDSPNTSTEVDAERPDAQPADHAGDTTPPARAWPHSSNSVVVQKQQDPVQSSEKDTQQGERDDGDDEIEPDEDAVSEPARPVATFTVVPPSSSAAKVETTPAPAPVSSAPAVSVPPSENAAQTETITKAQSGPQTHSRTQTPVLESGTAPASATASPISPSPSGAGKSITGSQNDERDLPPGPEGDPTDWSVEEVAQWGRSRGWDEKTIVSKFIEHEITGDVLLEMDVNILKEIEITAFGKRFQVASAIKELKKGNNGNLSPAPVTTANGWNAGDQSSSSGGGAFPASGAVGSAIDSSSTSSSPFMRTLQSTHLSGANGAAGGSSAGGSISGVSGEEVQYQTGFALSPAGNETQYVSQFQDQASSTSTPISTPAIGNTSVPSAGGGGGGAAAAAAAVGDTSGSTFGPSSSSAATPSGSTPSPAPTPRARVSFSSTVQTVPPLPAMASNGITSTGYGEYRPPRMRSSGQLGQSRGGPGSANGHGKPGGGAWPAHLVSVSTNGYGIGNVDARRDSRSSQGHSGTVFRTRDSYSSASPSAYGSYSGAGGGGGAGSGSSSGHVGSPPPPLPTVSGGTYVPPVLPGRRDSASAAVELNMSKGSTPSGNSVAGDDPDNAVESLAPVPGPRTNTERENGRAVGSGERTSFFASLTNRTRKPAPRASQIPAEADISAGSGNSGSGAKSGGGLGARFRKQVATIDKESISTPNTAAGGGAGSRDSQTGSMSPASGGPMPGGRSSFGSGKGGAMPGAHSRDPSLTMSRAPTNGSIATGAGGGDTAAAISGASGVPGDSVLGKIQPVDLEGWMLKKGERYATWKPRYLALKGPDLVVLRAPDAEKIKGYISMKGYRVIADENTNPGKYGFKLVHETERPHSFSSADPAMVRAWMKALMKSTIGRDHSFPVISSYNNKTISLREAQAMYPPPRPPSPDSRLRVQRANIRANPNSLSAKDAAILTGLIPKKTGPGGK